ncbi:NADP-dependent oxidoreductase [Deinococcus sonorensis]|uniref:NADP-dependent oxidoreductase n=2 Tax=Deinococcus sonorensis TaxID=309891 RepID=A0AAU7U6Z4_9DEIO
MRSATFHTFGDPSVLRVEETDWPTATRDEVLIHVHASSINGTDLGLRAGQGPFRLAVRLPFTPGFDVAGVVVRCGPQVTAFHVGDPVMALLGHGGGGAAEYVAVRQSRVARAPERLSLLHAAAVPLSGLTALQGLRRGAALHTQPRARVLVIGAAGGIGSFAVQLARLYGAHVTGVARPEKQPYVRDLGADDTCTPDELNGPSFPAWDVILDAAPRLTLSAARPLLTARGVLVSVRPIPTQWPEVRSLAHPGGHPRFYGVQTRERGQDLSLLAHLIGTGQLRVPVDRSYPLTQIQDAHRYAEGPEVRGKVIVTSV